MEKRLGFVGIVVEERKIAATKINEILSCYGDGIIGRMGVPYRERHRNVITLIVEMTTDEVGAMTGALGMIEGVVVKSALTKE
jgi:putative iron-only hydrogenase system regulator